jgi:hypothetical protein
MRADSILKVTGDGGPVSDLGGKTVPAQRSQSQVLQKCVMSSAARNREYPATSTSLLCTNDEQRRWTMRTRVRVVGANSFSR